jgi:inositol phosphorylceramide synthase catalytic subunit
MEWCVLSKSVMGSTNTRFFLGLDGHYLFLSIIGIFALSVIEAPGPIIKTLLATLLLTGLVIPISRQILLPALPVITWAVLFYSAR